VGLRWLKKGSLGLSLFRMKLYLASQADQVLNKIDFNKRKKLGFIANASDLKENKDTIDLIKEALIKKEKDLKIIDIDLRNKTKEQLKKELDKVEIIFVNGGNAFYLLEKVKESGFDELVRDLVNQGVIYIGSSAGSCIMGSSLEPIRLMDDLNLAKNLKSYKGIGLVDFVIVPHSGRGKYGDQIKKIIKEYKDKYKLVTLTDDEFIEVDENGYKIIRNN